MYCNPFLEEILIYEKEALGSDALEEGANWSMDVSEPDRVRSNTWRVMERLEPLMNGLRGRLNADVSEADRALYEDGVLFLFYYRLYPEMSEATFRSDGKTKGRWAFYGRFREEFREFTGLYDPAHIFACYYQIVRAFHHIFEQIIGNSPPAARLRAAIWQSLFTHDMRRYQRTLYPRMSEFATLVTGPSGTGKELVARSVAMSRYVPFDQNRITFQEEPTELFFPINIAALPGTLVESELFGHKRGSFTGAIQDKRGWLEACPPLGAVFLDEIGDLDPEIQVKLLRVIETRSFQAVGEGSALMRRFQGKLIAATNRDLWTAIRERRFREDLYYRLCSDQICTPSLRQQVLESPEVLDDLILFMSRRVAGEEAESLAAEAQEWVRIHLGPDYGWPGNYRELEQCVRNILIRKDYQAAGARDPKPEEDLFADAENCRLTAEQLLSRYCTFVYSKTGSYEETARRLDMDRRTVKAKVDVELLGKLSPNGSLNR
jgi:DNA-binding NtrC family response regulator